MKCRQKRLTKQSQYQKEKTANESVGCREKRLANQRQYQKEKTTNESVECREKRLLSKQEHRKSIFTNLTSTYEIWKFHAAVSRGPLHICSCCDQLWYRHSILAAEKLRLFNLDAEKCLLILNGSVSLVTNIWRKAIPPWAARNGMSFLVKPDYFDINELECRLLAPRLAFQKLMQAPRGNQLKIKELLSMY